MALINCDCEVCGRPKISGYCRNPECRMFVKYANDLEEALGRISERDILMLRQWRVACRQAMCVADKMLEEVERLNKERK